MEMVRDFILGGSKITADGNCSHKIKRHLLLGRKAMTKLFFFFFLKVAQSCLTPCDPTVHGILQTRILEWVVFPFSRRSSQPKDWTQVSHLDHILKSKDATLPTKVRLVKGMVFPVVIYGCESWTIKKAECQRIDAFEMWHLRRFLSPMDCKEIQPVNLKGNQSWMFIERNDAVAETPILWAPDMKSWLIGKDSDAGKVWRWEETGVTENEIVGWH